MAMDDDDEGELYGGVPVPQHDAEIARLRRAQMGAALLPGVRGIDQQYPEPGPISLAPMREAMLAISHEAARSMVRDAPLQWPELFERSANSGPSAAEIAADAAWNVKFTVTAAQPADPPLQGPPMPMPDKEPYPASLVERIAALERENAALRHEIDMGNAAEPEPVFPARALACWPGGAGGMARFLP